ncbi:hypothetical protein PISMIDRAFT_689302, partial [Pisolithus microcarpus 441]
MSQAKLNYYEYIHVVTVVRYTIQKPPSTGNGALKSQRHGSGLKEIQGMCHHGTT